jgi:hypothetical protein
MSLEMKRWSRLTDEMAIDPGDFLEARLETLSGEAVHNQAELIRELATRSMLRYESVPTGPALVLDLSAFLERPERTQEFYRRLFNADGQATQDLLTWVSETLALWLEESFEPLLIFADGGRPHDTEPAYDVVSLVVDENQVTRLRLVQVKATKNQLQTRCSQALQKFRKLEAGDYDAELLSRLRLLEERGRIPPTVNPRELLNDPRRRYRVTCLHGEKRDEIGILSLYSEAIPGERQRRSARLVFVEEWNEFWKRVSDEIYAQLS